MKKQLIYSLIAALSINSSYANAVSIPLHSVSQDIAFLADDKLKGRKVFTKEIDQAAGYIASRFKQVGLQPFKSSFKQQFSIFSIVPEKASLTLNGKAIDTDNIALATTARQFSWTQDSEVTSHVVSESDDLRSTLSTLNLSGGNHLVLVNVKHQELFKRYQHYFQGGLTKLNDSNVGTIMMVLTDSPQIDNFEASGMSTITPKNLTNVVGVLPGKSKPEEVILYTAHYDHLGTKLTKVTTEEDANSQDIIYNGADDNASGVTGVLNLAQHFATQRNNERTLMFVAFTAEEIGGWGSKYFSQHLPADNVIAMINLEMIGKVSKFGAGRFWMTGKERSNLGSIMNESLRGKMQPIEPDPYPKQQLFYRSDNATLARLGVPAHSFSTVQLEQDKHYHALSDELETINVKSLKTVIESIAVASKRLVDGSATPSRVDVSKVTSSGKIY